ncbi:Uncharacterised protein at_DN0009 [Pycnogonum litorale]
MTLAIGEDTLTGPQYGEDELSVTLEPEVIDVDKFIYEEAEVLVAKTTYIAEEADNMCIVEGERVTVIEKTNPQLWFVKKSLTQAMGSLPKDILLKETDYAVYLKEKMTEKMQKIPVFDQPKPGQHLVAPRFIKKLETVHVCDGQTATFTCKVEGTPRPTVTWFRQTAIIKPSSEFEIYYNEDNVSQLIIKEVFPEDTGTFTVVAKNTAGYTSCSSELVVELPLSDHGSTVTPISRRSLSRESSVAEFLEGIPPVFSQLPKEKIATKGTDAELECRLVGYPQPQLTWIFKGQILEESRRITKTTQSDVHFYRHILTIKNVTFEDTGKYEVIATNSEGYSTVSASLIVKDTEKDTKKEGEEPPTFTQTFSDITVIEKETIKLTTKVTGNPRPEITWFRNNKRLRETKSIKKIYEKEVCSLEIKEASIEKHTGEYKCVASNPHGKISHAAKVTIHEAGADFVEKLREIEVKERDMAIFTAKLSREDAEVSWHKDGEQITPSDKHECVSEGKYRKLIVHSSDVFDEGEYTCLLGEKECTGELIVIELPPEIISRPEDIVIRKEETATLTVELTKGDALVKWFKGPKEVVLSERVQVKIDGKRQSLMIQKATIEDAGQYSCVVSDQKCTVKVQVVEPSAEFTAMLPEKTVSPPDVDAKFTVELNYPDVEVKWLRDGREITDDGRFLFIKEGKKRELLVRSVSRDDMAEYTCTAGDAKTSTKFHVEEEYSEFTLTLQDTVVKESEDAVLLVEVTNETEEVKWYKNGEPIIPETTQHYYVESMGRQHKLVIRSASLDDMGLYSCAVEERECSAQLLVASPPKVKSETRQFTVKRSDTLLLDIPYSGFPVPTVEWAHEGEIIKLPTSKIVVETTDDHTVMYLREIDERHIGSYSLRLRNEAGEDQAEFSVDLIDRPGAPGTPEVVSSFDDGMTLRWDEPPSDGGSSITNYYIEYHDRSSTRWTTFNTDFNIPETHHTVTGLTQDNEYMFRITAVNASGPGVPSPASKYIPVQIHDGLAPVILEPLQNVTAGVKETLTLRCVISGQPAPTVQWFKNGCEIVSKKNIHHSFDHDEALLEICGTTYKSAGEYSCKATNKSGSTETSCSVVIQVPPSAEFDEDMLDVRLKARYEYNLEVKISGYPLPEITWFKDRRPLESSKHVLVRIHDKDASVYIFKVEREDSGIYSLRLSNTAAIQTYDFSLRVLDKPAYPEGPIYFSNIMKDTVTLQWKPPKNDGGSETKSYYIEKCDTKRMVWVGVDTIKSSFNRYVVKDLQEGREYMFRCSAENIYGVGEPLTSDPVTPKTIHDPPSSPTGPLMTSNDTETSFTLSWNPPIMDGGAPVLEYNVERKEVGKKAWLKVGSTDGKTLSMEVTNLKNSVSYNFRITCKNEVGMSSLLCPEETFSPGGQIAPPSKPAGPLRIAKMTTKTMTIRWGHPADNGGSELTGFVIEKQESKTSQWVTVATVDPHILTFTIPNLSDKYEYTFRVSAENAAGLSLPLESEKGLRLTSKADRPMPPTGPVEMHCTGPSSVIIEWGLPESDGGSPLICYTVILRDMRRTMWMEVGQVAADTQKLNIKDLHEGHQYMVRILARNEVGDSDPLESDEPIEVITPQGFTAADIVEHEAIDRTPSFSFSTETSSWIREANVEPLLYSYTKHVLVRRHEYFFRLWCNADKLFE